MYSSLWISTIPTPPFSFESAPRKSKKAGAVNDLRYRFPLSWKSLCALSFTAPAYIYFYFSMLISGRFFQFFMAQFHKQAHFDHVF
nr:MAG TPA: hypothetical protein [Caudoviricetes sp.]